MVYSEAMAALALATAALDAADQAEEAAAVSEARRGGPTARAAWMRTRADRSVARRDYLEAVDVLAATARSDWDASIVSSDAAYTLAELTAKAYNAATVGAKLAAANKAAAGENLNKAEVLLANAKGRCFTRTVM